AGRGALPGRTTVCAAGEEDCADAGTIPARAGSGTQAADCVTGSSTAVVVPVDAALVQVVRHVLERDNGVNVLHAYARRHVQGQRRVAEDATDAGLDQLVGDGLGGVRGHGNHSNLAPRSVNGFRQRRCRLDFDFADLRADLGWVVVKDAADAKAAIEK